MVIAPPTSYRLVYNTMEYMDIYGNLWLYLPSTQVRSPRVMFTYVHQLSNFVNGGPMFIESFI